VAFYGGTALRIFYGIDRFSEDLDFSLLGSNESFSIEKYLKPIEDIVNSMGLVFETTRKEKTKESNIDSAFIKGNTKETFIVIYPNTDDYKQIIQNEKITIKFEVDVNPPLYATTELKYRLLPFPYQVRVYDKESLFAGKIHAVIARSWKSRVKGRDLYDYLYYLSLDTKVNLKHLEARLKQTNTIEENTTLTRELLIKILNDRFDNIDYENAKLDAKPFINDSNSLDLWSNAFFKGVTENIKC
jgi:predicted nucleotidyltransferase component of viral defense system